jgi:hypothetical protein
MHHCESSLNTCNEMICQDHGGTKSVTEKPRVNAVGTPECDAWCARVTALNCGGEAMTCNASFWCEVREGDCLESTRAHLQCEAEQGTFQCQGTGWSVSSGCSLFRDLCPASGDAGSD